MSEWANDGYPHDLVNAPTDKVDTGDTQPQNIVDFSNMSAEELTEYAMKNPDFYKNNAGLFDYWLEEKSYKKRWDMNSLKSQFAQLKELGINPMLAMSLISGASQGLSGGATSNSASYLASRENNKVSAATSRANNITTSLRASIIPIIVAILAAML